MPIYTEILNVPAGTASDNPATATITVEEYTVTRIDIYFPPGCHGLVHVVVFYGAEQLAPKPTGKTIVGNAETVSWPEEWKCPDRPATLEFRGWAPLTNYDHNILCRVVTRPLSQEEKVREAAESQSLLVRFLKHLIGVR